MTDAHAARVRLAKFRAAVAALAPYLPLAKTLHAREVAMCVAVARRRGVKPPPVGYADPWAGEHGIHQQLGLLREARDLAAQLAGLGHVVAPVEPTADMATSGFVTIEFKRHWPGHETITAADPAKIYRAMVAAGRIDLAPATDPA